MFKLVITDPSVTETVKNGGQPLLSLCRQQVEAFDHYLRTCGNPMFSDGLLEWEKQPCIGLLYQMYRGRLDIQSSPSELLESAE